MRFGLWFVLAATIVLTPSRFVSAQCAVMSGSGHQHDGAADHHRGQESPRGPDEKALAKARKFLDDPKSREALLEVIVEDDAFIRLLIVRLAETPEGRSLLSGRAESPAVPEYRCPMHPDVVADKPGRCPECGMPLERVSTESKP